jgi:hypothetical protein
MCWSCRAPGGEPGGAPRGPSSTAFGPAAPARQGGPGTSVPPLPDREPRAPRPRYEDPLQRPTARLGGVRCALACPDPLHRSSCFVSLFLRTRRLSEAGAASPRREASPCRSARLRLMFPQETLGSPTAPRPPFACLPRSQTPVGACALAIPLSGLRPAGPCTPAACPRYDRRTILLPTTLPIAGLPPAASRLVPSSCVRPCRGGHVDVTPDRQARRCSGGIDSSRCAPTGEQHPIA